MTYHQIIMKNKKNKNTSALVDAAQYFGGIPKLANALGIDRHAIYQWRKIPTGRAYQIEILTNGQLKAADLLRAQKSVTAQD